MQRLDKQLDVFTREELRTLLASRERPCVSIYMPTHRVWSGTGQDPIRLKNLVRRAEGLLQETDMRSSEIRTLLQPARNLAKGEERFWQHQSDGLALFLGPREFRSYRLPVAFDELVVVNKRYHVKPLLRLWTEDSNFFVLALSQSKIRMLSGSASGFSDVELGEDIPVSLAEALRFDEFEAQQQLHVTGAQRGRAGNRPAQFHGQGGAGDEANVKRRIQEFLRQVDTGVVRALGAEQAPLVIAGLDHLRGMYRKANHYPNLVDADLVGNPDEWDDGELHRRAWDVVKERFQRGRVEAAATFRHLQEHAPERIAQSADEIVPEAYFHRVDTLFVPQGRQVWGRFDPSAQKVQRHEVAEPGDADLLDFAATHTLINGGAVYLVPPEEMPSESEAVAIYRYG